MLATAQTRWFQLVYVTSVLLALSIGLPHWQSGNINNYPQEDLEKVLDESDQLKPHTGNTDDDDHEHESQVFFSHGKAQLISNFGPTGKTNMDEKGLDPKARFGDILVEDDEKEISKRKALTSSRRLWPNGIVPWYFDPNRKFQYQSSRDKVWDAIYHWQNLTCLRFPYRNTDRHYVRIGTGFGCSSHVGLVHTTQVINLVELGMGNCLNRGSIAHEIGHTIGFFHEQSRSDRDNYVEILSENIADQREQNFQKVSTSVAVEYDLESNMHYGLYAFSKNRLPTIKVKRQELSFLAGSRHGLTFYDAKLANLIYNCADGCTNTCHNHGYPFKTPAGKCVCNCPPFLTGDCNTLDTSKTDCGGVYHLDAANPTVTIQSPNYPNNYDQNKICAYVFKVDADAGSGVELSFSDFDVAGSSRRCYHFVQINANLIGQTGVKYCGKLGSLPTDVNTFMDHNSTEMMVIFDTKDTRASTRKGFKFTAKAVGALGSTARPTTTISPGPEGQISCSFDQSGLCGWTQATDDDFDWTLRSGSTPTRGTGPTGGDRGTPYIYADVRKQKRNAKATIYTDYFKPDDYFFSFKWHMYGSSRMGTLTLSTVTESGTETVLFQKSGNQGNVWQSSEYNITATEKTKLVITGTKYKSGKGDIALDSFVMKRLDVSKLVLSCDFETGYLCRKFFNDPKADYSWSQRKSPTPTPYTGPTYAYEGPPFHSYIYAEASWQDPGDVARLLLSKYSGATKKPFCLSWAYHMFGCHMGSLRVRLVNSKEIMEDPIWSKEGEQGNYWKTASVYVDRTDIIRVAFEAIRGSGARSDIALDVIKIHAASSCP